MKKIALLASVVVMSSAIAFEESETRVDKKYPTFMSQGKYLNSFNSLPLSSELSLNKLPWASSFWPSIYGGIAFRWNDYHNSIPSFAQLHYNINDINDEIASLSKELYSNNQSSYEAASIYNKIVELKKEKQKINYNKSLEHSSALFTYARPKSFKDIKKMSSEQIYKLSPAEKYDVYKMMIGESSKFTLTNKILTKKTGPFKAYWEGVCHGWSSAALEFHEPEPITIRKKGVELTFNSSDLKALLSQYHAHITAWPDRGIVSNQYGRICKTDIPEESWSLNNGKETYKSLEEGRIVSKAVPSECDADVDAGGFHLVLANQIGVLQEGFVVEATRDREIWNQPVFGYDSEVLEESTSLISKRNKGTVKQVKVKTIMKYANDGGRMYWRKDVEAADDQFYAWEEKTSGTDNYRYASKTYEYILDLDKNGNILGGHWLSYERPDFLWIKRNKGFIKGRSKIARYMNDLQNLVEVRK